MNFAVFGWYHHQNEGDDRMQRCITRWLDGHTLAFLPAGRPPPRELLRTYDGVLIGGGGLIQREGGMFRDMAGWVKRAGIPVALVSVSVEGSAPELLDELRAFLDVCCFAWFRDRGSLEQVGEHARAFVAPDVTWLFPYASGESPGNTVAVCLRKQAGLDTSAWRRALAGLNHALVPWPLYFEQGGDAAVLREVLPHARMPEEFHPGPAREAAAVISGRYHGVIYALQMGRPVLAVSSLPKTRRFLAEHGLERWCVGENEPDRLRELWPEFREAWPELGARAREIAAHLRAEAAEKAAGARKRFLEAAELSRDRRLGSRLRSFFRRG